YVTLAERLVDTAPISGQAKAAFFNAGTEAVENAVKFARAYTKRPAVIGFEGGFHGRTLLALTLTSKTHPYKAGLGPFAPEVYRLPFAQDYRGPTSAEALGALERALVTSVAAESVAAIVIEWKSRDRGCPRGFRNRRHLCRQSGRASRRSGRPRRLRGGGTRGGSESDRGHDSQSHAGVAAALGCDRRRPGTRLHAGDRA